MDAELKPRQSDANEIRKCCHCQNSFEVPTGYLPDGWKCARCQQTPTPPLCRHQERKFGSCLLCGCLLTSQQRQMLESGE